MKKLASAFAIVLMISAQLFAASPVHELSHTVLGGAGGWDYLTVDPSQHRLYIARSNRVMVVDTSTNRLIREVAGLDGAHGVALDQDDGLGFATSGKSNSVEVFDLKTLKVVSTIPAGTHPDAIVYDHFSSRVFAFNGKSHDVSVIDPKIKKVIGRIELSGKLEFAVSDEAGHIYVNVEDKNQMFRFDSRSLAVLNTFELALCLEPTGLSIDRINRRLFVGCGNQGVSVVDADTGRMVVTLRAGSGIDATAYDPIRHLIYASAGEGLMSVIHQTSKDSYEKLADVPTQKGARTLALDPEMGHTYLVTASFGSLQPSVDGQRPRPSIVPNTFRLLVFGTH